jgi:hypothetical protein
MKINRFTLFVVLIITSAFPYTEKCFDSTIIAIQKEIAFDLKKYQIQWDDTTYIFQGNAFIPNCSTISCNKIKIELIGAKELESATFWIQRTLTNWLFNKDSIIVLKRMKREDDWIVGLGNYKGTYAQYIDGRTLTVLIKSKLNIQDTIHFENNLFNLTKHFIRLGAFGKQEKIAFKKEYQDSIQVIGTIIDSLSSEEIRNKKKDMFWTNGKYIVIDIIKIRSPYKDRVGFHPEQTIGGISHKDPRTFKRFSTENNFNFKNEMYIQFPWVKDTIESWKKQNVE